MSTEPVLEVRGLVAGYGKVTALFGADLQVPAGKVVTVIGPNGAGKSTLLNAITGILRSQGEIRFEGRPVQGKSVEAKVMAGIALVPERRELFSDMSVFENLRLGAFRRHRLGDRAYLDQLDWVYSLFPRLAERSRQQAGTLSGGERQMLAVGRALMGKPTLLMLDEPSLGLAPMIVADLLEVVGRLGERGISTLLVEQNARAALRIASDAYVLENGKIALSGKASDIAQHPLVVQSYLGIRSDGPTAAPASKPEPEPAPPAALRRIS